MSGQLRVAIFAETYLPYLSGVTVATETLARGLGAAGQDVLLVAPRPGGDGAPGTAGAPGPEPSYAWLPSYAAPPPAPPGYRMPFPWPSPALREARAFAPDVVHAQSPFVSGLMARRLAQRLQAPLVFTHHTRFGDYGHYLGPLATAGRRAGEAYLRDFWGGCAGIVAPGSELAEEIRAALGDPARPVVRAIPTGVDVAGIRAIPPGDVRAEHGWPADTTVAVSLGRIAPEKSVTVLVEAFATAAARDPKLRLLLVGGGPSEAAIRNRAAQPDLAGRVAVTGLLPRREALARVRGGDLFVFASRTETQGLVLCEALAAGLPVVALSGPGVADSVRNGVDGVVVPRPDAPHEAGALAHAILRLAGDAEGRAAMGAAAAEGAKRFDVPQRIGQVVDLYRELLDR
ncbi:MAG TPA: glycosyltransferase [Candidatus Limnocylindria bacterium]|nr:glycosyltransferase [Candidatus Limnocylindria bacterium]